MGNTALVSACLVGFPCRHNGQAKAIPALRKAFAQGRLVPFCPELAGGLGVPRDRAEIRGGAGEEVWQGKAQVVAESGVNLTQFYIKGAQATLLLARSLGLKEAFLKSHSPSCGAGKVYDGTFSGRLKVGDGVTAALLRKNGFKLEVF
jgi:uncharacterized protein YbbK (DUF523 family)